MDFVIIPISHYLIIFSPERPTGSGSKITFFLDPDPNLSDTVQPQRLSSGAHHHSMQGIVCGLSVSVVGWGYW